MEDDEFVQAVEASQKHQQKVLADVLRKGPYGQKVVGKASQMASTFAEDDGLHPTLDVENREWRYTLKQGLRAACVGREDAAAVLIVMSTVYISLINFFNSLHLNNRKVDELELTNITYKDPDRDLVIERRLKALRTFAIGLKDEDNALDDRIEALLKSIDAWLGDHCHGSC